MYVYNHQNAAGSLITATSTATNIFDLINTAASTSLPYAGFPGDSNSIDIKVEGAVAIRILYQVDPTTTEGFLIGAGDTAMFRGVPLSKLSIISAGANTNCSVLVGAAQEGETSTIATSATSGGGGTSDVNLIEVGGVATSLGIKNQTASLPVVEGFTTDYKQYEDSNFVVGDSPAVLDINTDLGRNGNDGTVVNDGNGDFTFTVTSSAGIGDAITMTNGDSFSLKGMDVDTITITFVANSSYRVFVK